MIKKIVDIKNYGKFKNFSIGMSNWDGVLKKINIIYAPNGSGKTSFSVLLNSIKGNNEIILKKKTFDQPNNPSIKFLLCDNKELKFTNKCQWNKTISKIETFDSFYYENNLYSITIEDAPNKPNIFEISISDEIEKIKQDIQLKTNLKIGFSKQISNRKSYLRKQNLPYEKDKKHSQLCKEREKLEIEISKLQQERIDKTEFERNRYINYINNYLELFCDSICLTEIKIARNSTLHTQNIIYGIEINGHNIAIKDRNNGSLKYYLSDGDKNALALSFFLAKMKMLPNLNQYIVVIDDPFTSFDTQRKTTTITQLVKLSKKVNQFFLLTHDLHFANEFNNACNEEVLNLRIQNNNNSSIFNQYDIKFEMLTGFNKDLSTLRNFVNGKIIDDEIHLREVIRCIRPTLEGVFRIKYFNYISDNQWLGDFISLIRNSTNESPLYRLKEFLPEIEEINNYSKIYHHSNPNYHEVPISYHELMIYTKRTLKLIEII